MLLKSLAVSAVVLSSLVGVNDLHADERVRADVLQNIEQLERKYNAISELARERNINRLDAHLEINWSKAYKAIEGMTSSQIDQLNEQNGIYSQLEQLSVLADNLQVTLSQETSPKQYLSTLSVEAEEVDTENMDLESCLDQLALTGVSTPLRLAANIADWVNDLVPANIVSAGQSVPNPLKVASSFAKHTAKHLLYVADEALRYNALCTLRNERKIVKDYVQKRQVRFTPKKEITATFDIMRPENLGNRDKYRYTFWMHVKEDGQPVSANVTKILASQLEHTNDSFVEIALSQADINEVSTGLYKVVLDTPVDKGLDFVRSFVIHFKHNHFTPDNKEYAHYGVAHIQSHENSKDF